MELIVKKCASPEFLLVLRRGTRSASTRRRGRSGCWAPSPPSGEWEIISSVHLHCYNQFCARVLYRDNWFCTPLYTCAAITSSVHVYCTEITGSLHLCIHIILHCNNTFFKPILYCDKQFCTLCTPVMYCNIYSLLLYCNVIIVLFTSTVL